MELIRVYKNLNKKCYSIQKKTDKGWRVQAYSWHLELFNCKFKVYESGRQKVLKTRRKNVHAYIEGYLSDIHQFDVTIENGVKVSYDPYKDEQFKTIHNNTYIYEAKQVLVGMNGVYV